ncbi:PREDICTED: facilitated trehalose transporter Tret1 isoform X1 [Acromyrmex echinatior]|uniref:Sugar transporter ERD6-like 7 n=2 Tax=Acromyrmex echinatior TaxID=103372 RepID=F4X144_ACREC|nr:PREDICTED: facilitated trehalose transporter Tret1 isoform X1 [Acromyrmex echinatior]EGI59828.1 Sugar transporter ERD6-like 7 [Acromyrmex echinatior]
MTTEFVWDADNAATTSTTDERTPLLSASGQAMSVEKIGISQQTLVSTDGLGRAKRLPQYLAGLAATLGALAAGMVLGWTSPAGENGVNLAKNYDIKISITEFSWIGSLATLGAGAMCIPIGIIADLIGRKTAMLIMVVPFTIGWLLIIFSNSVLMFYFGRFITGLSGGAFCVAAPLYTAEIAEKEIRGTLGSYFQLLLTVGILAAYVFGAIIENMRTLSIICAVMPLIFFGIFFFMPETPVYYLKKGNEEAARKSLIKFRGNEYDVEAELQAHREALEETRRSGRSFFDSIKSPAAKKGFVIAYGLMLFQQMSGVNSIIFYSSDIFSRAGNAISPDIATIIVGTVQVVSVFFGTLVVDKLGRRILLLISITVMFLMTLLLGIYFYCLDHTTAFDNITWFALIPLCTFLVVFSVGFGPIPWMMMPEIFAPEVKGIAGSSACLFNWLMAFIVTKFYSDMKEAVQSYGTFWIFSLFSAVGTLFVYFLVPETKGKTLDQIQRELNG